MSHLFNKAVNYLSGGEGDPFVGASVDIETHKLSVKSVLGDGMYLITHHGGSALYISICIYIITLEYTK